MKAKVKEQLQKLQQHYKKIGFKVVGVFGSYARGDEQQESDLDLVYEVDTLFLKQYDGWNAMAKIEEIKEEIKRALGVPKVDFVPKDTPNVTLQKMLKNEMIYV